LKPVSSPKEQQSLSADPPPYIPFAIDEAYLKLRRDEYGIIRPSYRFKECEKRILVCVKWKIKTVWFNELEWFMINGWGLSKRKSLIK
jgi:hypothetical protein